MLQQSTSTEAAPASPGKPGPSWCPTAMDQAQGLRCISKPALTAHLHQLPAPASDPQISDFSAAEMELEVRDLVADYQKKVTLDEVITSRRFLLAVKTPPHVGNLGSRVNQPFFTSGTNINLSCHFSWAGRSMVTLLMKRSSSWCILHRQHLDFNFYFFKGRGKKGVTFEHNSRLSQSSGWVMTCERAPYRQSPAVSLVSSSCLSLSVVSLISSVHHSWHKGCKTVRYSEHNRFLWISLLSAPLKANKSVAWRKTNPEKRTCFLIDTSVHYQGMSTPWKSQQVHFTM